MGIVGFAGVTAIETSAGAETVSIVEPLTEPDVAATRQALAVWEAARGA